jgi:hypothetical protein
VNPPVCTSGIAIDKPRLTIHASEFSLRLKGQAVIPKPWSGVNPAVNGVRIAVDSPTGAAGIDVVVPGGPLWKVNGTGTRWTYRDPAGTVAGITTVVVRDRSTVSDGLLRWTVKGSGGAIALPDASAVRTAVVLGDPNECASLDWNPPEGSRPRCDGDSAVLHCR